MLYLLEFCSGRYLVHLRLTFDPWHLSHGAAPFPSNPQFLDAIVCVPSYVKREKCQPLRSIDSSLSSPLEPPNFCDTASQIHVLSSLALLQQAFHLRGEDCQSVRDMWFEVYHCFRTECMGYIFASSTMHQPVPRGKYALSDVIEGVVKLRFQKPVAMTENVLCLMVSKGGQSPTTLFPLL